MVANRKKKYESGEGSLFMSRKAALRRLQLTLKDFRRLCIIKGIYPREPRNRKRAQQGDTGIKTLYHKKDIQFLMHEPIIWKLREYKIFSRKVGRAKAMRDFASMRRYLANHPVIKLDHIVKERYPTFIDALRDLDDCLTLCFLFSTFPSLPHVPREHSVLCRRLTVEFMHAVIAAKALRKVFVSIKGYYYQAEIKGQTITWIVPHHFAFEPQAKNEVDFKVMSTFVEFYTVMLGFVNFRLYHMLNMYYPPKFSTATPDQRDLTLVDEEAFVAERIAALNIPLSKSGESGEQPEDDIDIDMFPETDDPQKLEEAKEEIEKIKKLKTLFQGLKFYVNREVPREPLVFLIRSFGGEVSWDKILFVGSTFDEDDETITHQIVDRPSLDKKYISRYYVQPQWIFDCVNQRSLLPTSSYLMGATLPPHLSPFVDKNRDQEYVPPEELAMMDPELLHKEEKADASADESDSSEEETKAETKEKPQQSKRKQKRQSKNATEEQSKEEPEEEAHNPEALRDAKKKKMAVTTGELHKENPWESKQQEKQEYRLREKMIKKKHRNLYKSMMKGRSERSQEAWLLKKKRRLHDEQEKETKKQTRKAAKAKLLSKSNDVE